MTGYKKICLKYRYTLLNFNFFFETQKYSRWHKKGWHKDFKIGGWHKNGGIKNIRGGIKRGGIKIREFLGGGIKKVA